MVLFLREDEVQEVATMALAVGAVEEAFRLQGQGLAENTPRRRCRLDGGMLHVLSGSLPPLNLAGLKSYSTVPGGARFHVCLYGGADGRLLAIMEADKLGQMRTGAATGVATKYMARENATRAGIIGTGWQARSQLEGLCAVRPIETVIAYGRDATRRESFCREMTEKLGIGVYPADSPEQAAGDVDIVVTATSAKQPVLFGDWLAEGTHVNAIGSNSLSRQEIDVETVRRSACVVVDSAEQARLEAGDLAHAEQAGAFFWEDARELGLVVTSEFPGREDDREITLFKSIGIAIEDVALAGKVYEAARAAGAGKELPIG